MKKILSLISLLFLMVGSMYASSTDGLDMVWVKYNADYTPTPAEPQDGIGVDGSRGISIVSPAGAAEDWDTQIFIMLKKKIPAGTKLSVSFDYKASSDVTVETQSHTTPGEYLHWEAVGNVDFTPSWQTFDTWYYVPYEADGMQFIAFNLSADRDNDVTFYIDNIKVIYGETSGTSGTCEWMIDDNDLLTIRPVDGVNGVLESWWYEDVPWYENHDRIAAARIEAGVDAASCRHLFDDCFLLQEVWWEPDVIPADAIGTGTAANMIVYAPEGTESELDYNVVIGGKCDYLKLTEGEPLSISQEFEAEQAVLTRTFQKPTLVEQSAGWESIVVPFDVTSIIDEQDRPLAPFGSDKTGTHPFWLAQMEAGDSFTYSTEMRANTPYLIAMPNSPLYIDEFNITGEVQFIGENVTVQMTSDAQTIEGGSLKLIPTYMEIAAEGTGLYALNREAFIDDELNERPAGSVFMQSNTTAALPFEFYVMPKTAPVKGQIIPIEIDNTADQLRRLYADTYGSLDIHSENSQLVIQATKPQVIGIYNAQGMLVSKLHLQPGENRTPQLPSGLYVVGKEKYMVK